MTTGSDFFGVDDLMAQWAEEDMMVRLWDESAGVRVYEPTTRLYRGAELVWNTRTQLWDAWWLPVSGREGYLGSAATVPTTERIVDAKLAGCR